MIAKIQFSNGCYCVKRNAFRRPKEGKNENIQNVSTHSKLHAGGFKISIGK